MPSSSSPALAIVLAAGKGTRMKSDLPKVLVPVCERPMICYVVDALQAAGIERIVVVVGYRAELVREELKDFSGVEFADQREQLGTGHAVMMCRRQLQEHHGPVFIIAGDSPMLQASSVRSLLDLYGEEQAACLIGTVDKQNPTGYGRVIRDSQGNFQEIIEEKDATDEQRAIQEVNVSTYVFDSQQLLSALDQLTDNNVQGEYYVTDCPALMKAAGERVSAHNVLQPCEAMSINNMAELREVEEQMRINLQSAISNPQSQ